MFAHRFLASIALLATAIYTTKAKWCNLLTASNVLLPGFPAYSTGALLTNCNLTATGT